MADTTTDRPRQPCPAPDRFEFYEVDPTAHLTAEQKTWRVVTLVQRERVAMLEPKEPNNLTGEQKTWPTVELVQQERFAESGAPMPLPPAVGSSLAVVIPFPEGSTDAYVGGLNAFDKVLGGTGLTVTARRPGPTGDELTLTPNTPAGAAERLAKLAAAVTALGVGSARVA